MYTFDLGSFFLGLGILIASGVFIAFHQKISDAMGGGMADYEKYKLYGLIGCGIGIVLMLSLHTILLNFILSQLFGVNPK